MTEDEMVGCITDSVDMSLEIGERQGSLVCCSPWGRKESDVTWPLNHDRS